MDFRTCAGREALLGDDGYDAMARGSPGIGRKGGQEERCDEEGYPRSIDFLLVFSAQGSVQVGEFAGLQLFPLGLMGGERRAGLLV